MLSKLPSPMQKFNVGIKMTDSEKENIEKALHNSKPEKMENEDIQKLFRAWRSKAPLFPVIQKYAGTKQILRISSFNHSNVTCVVLEANTNYVRLLKAIDGGIIYITPASIKVIETISETEEKTLSKIVDRKIQEIQKE